MAASDPYPHSSRLPPGVAGYFTADALGERLDEEISRAERHGTPLGCLLVVIENLGEMTREHGSELREQTLDYVAGALGRELRRFDRIGRVGRDGQAGYEQAGDLLVILPGADSPQAEIVARRALERLRAIKVEARGTRLPLQVSVGLAAWRADVSAEELLTQVYTAVGGAGEDGDSEDPDDGIGPAVSTWPTAGTDAPGELPPAVGRAGRS